MTDPGALFGQIQSEVASLNASLAADGAKDVSAYLATLSGLRVFVPGASGAGRQASSVTVLNRLIALGCPATVEIAYEAGAEDILELLLPGYQGGAAELSYRGKTLTFTAFTAGTTQLLAVALCVTGGLDDDSALLPNPASALNADVFLQLQPYGWEAESASELGSQALNQIWLKAGDKPVTLNTVTALGGPMFDMLGFSAPAPALAEADWAGLKAALTDPAAQQALDDAEAVSTFLAGNPAATAFLPCGGILGSSGPLSTAVSALTLLASVAAFQDSSAATAKPAVVALIGEPGDSFVQEMKAALGLADPGDEDEPGPWADTITQLGSMVAGRVVPPPSLQSADPPPSVADQLQALQASHILLVLLPSLPPPAVGQLMSQATLPFTFEGQDDANLALNLGKPFLRLPSVSSGNSLADVVLNLPMMPAVTNADVNFSAWTAVQALLQAGVTTAKELADSVSQALLLSAGEPADSSAAFLGYFSQLGSFYQSGQYDKLTLALHYQLTLPSGTPGGTSPLQALYSALHSNSLGGTVDVYPGAIAAGSEPIPKALAALFGSGGLKVAGTPAFPSPSTTVSLAGPTTSFLGVTLQAALQFTLDTDGKTLLMALSLTGPTVTFDGVPWFAVDSPAVTVNVSNAGTRIGGSVSGTVSLGSTAVSLSASLPTVSTFVLDADVTENPPTLESVFQFIGGVNLASYLPSPLNALAGVGLKGLSFAYDYGKKKIASMTVTLEATPGWNLVGSLTLATVDLAFTVVDPAGARTISWQATSDFTLGPGEGPVESSGEIDLVVSYPGTTVTAALAPQSSPIALSALVACFLGENVTLPVSGDLSALTLMLTPGSPARYLLDVGVTGNWPVPSSALTVFTVESLGFHVDGTQSPPGVSLSGSVTFFASDPDLAFGLDVSAANSDPGGGWVITGQQNDSPVKVTDILTHYLPNNWSVSGLPEFEVTGFSAEIHVGSAALTPYYIISGTVDAFSNPILDGTIEATASFGNLLSTGGETGAVAAVAQDGAPALPFGHVSAEIQWHGITLDVGYDYAPGTQSYQVTWEGLTADLKQKAVDGTEHWIADLTFSDSATLGSMVETFVSWVTGYQFGLAAPWNLLDGVSLSGLTLTYDFTAGTVSFAVTVGPIDLGFCQITSVGLQYNSDAAPGDAKVQVTIEGSFAWISGGQLNWDATDPNSTPAPPGGGNEYFDLRLLAMGQHVLVQDISSATTVQDAITDLAALSAPSGQNLPAVTYDPASSWLVGTDFGVMKYDQNAGDYAVTLQVVFADPDLYGLRLALAGEPAKILAGLDFEVLYRKISDTIGVYQAQIALPTAIRTFQAGVFTIGLPVIAVAVYTNGDFQIDFGFPWNGDFTRSFTLQGIVPPGIPLTGAGGFYFGKLSSATTDRVPAVTNGTFDPVIVFGLGVNAGVGKSVEYGPLSASLSVVLLAIIEGVVARWNPYDSAQGGTTTSSQLDGTYYYSVSGTLGIAAQLSGSVDFAVIKASVNVSIVVTAQIVLTAYEPIVFTVAASVDVSASLSIDLGIFSVTINFHFSLTVSASFEVQSPSTGSPPWTVGSPPAPGRLTAPLVERLTSMRAARGLIAPAAEPAWTNLTAPVSPAALNGYLGYALTATGDAATTLAGQQACYVALLTLDAPALDAGTTGTGAGGEATTSWETLCQLVATWVIAAYSGQPQTAEQVTASVVTQDRLKAILDDLTKPGVTQPIPLDAVEAMLGQQVRLTIHDQTGTTDVTGAVFPVPPDLSLTVPTYGAFPGYDYSFGAYNSISGSAIASLQQYFGQLAIQLPRAGASDGTPAAAAAETASLSVAGFVFADYFLLIARHMVTTLREGLRDYKYTMPAGQHPADVVNWVNQTGQITAPATPFTVADLFAANSGAPLGSGIEVTISGAVRTVSPGDTFASIADGSGFTAADLMVANADNDTLLQAGAVVSFGGATTSVQTNDTLTLVATRLGTSANQPGSGLAADATLQGQAGLLMPFGRAQLPDYSVTAGGNTMAAGGNTLAGVASAAGVTVADLAGAGANAIVVGLFPAGTVLDLPHLPQFQVGALLAEAQQTGAMAQLAAMASRFQLHGLRLPTAGITPNHPGMWVTVNAGALSLPDTAGLYALTGQQVPLPALGTDPFSLTIGNPAGTGWLQFANGTTATTFTVTPGDINAGAITAMQGWITQNRLVTGAADLGAAAALSAMPTSSSFGPSIGWLSAALPSLPTGLPTAGATSARIWPLPAGLTALLDHDTHAVAPLFTVETQTYDQATGITTSAPIVNYGWASLIEFTVQQVPGAPNTYQVTGVADADSVLLEDLVAQFQSNDNFAGVWIGFPPDPSLHISGLQTGSTAVAFGIGQADLSTQTQPSAVPAAMAMAMATTGARPAALNGNAVFLRLLWEAAITASAGFYLYYSDGGSGLPGSVFDKDGKAALTLVVLYSTEVSGVADCMNAYVATDPVDISQSAVVATAVPQAMTVTPGATDTLGGLAASYYADLGQLAEDNSAVALVTGAVLTVSTGTYMVSPLGTVPGSALAAIAAYFGVSATAISGVNPGVTGSVALPPYTAIRLPAITVTVGTSAGGSTLGSIAAYYGTDVVSLAVDNQDTPGLFASPLTLTAGPTATSSTLPAGSQPYRLQRPVPSLSQTPPPSPPPADPQSVLLNQFSLLGYQIAANQDFAASNLGVPVGPAGAGGSGVGKMRRPNLLAEGDTWTYDVTLRYDDALASGGADDPYDAIGRLLQVEFTWVDMFGNTLITDLSDPQPGDAGPLNRAPALLGYTDPLIAVSQWPSVTARWSVTGAAGAALLTVELDFDTTRYTGTDSSANVAHAQADLAVYTMLAAQLADPNGVTVTVETSLSTAPFSFGPAELGNLTSWIGSITAYLTSLTSVEQGSPGTPPNPSLLFSFPLAATLNPAQLFELTCAVVMSRVGGRPQGAFAAVAGVGTVSTALAPAIRLAPGVSGVSPSSGSTGGGTVVTVSGTGLDGATGVSFGEVAGTITASSDTQITVTSPPGTGTVDIRVSTSAGTSAVTGADQFSYVASAPVVSGAPPSSGSTSGGTASGADGAASGADGAASGAGLQAFARDFEAALTSPSSVLKVAAGPNRFEGGAASPATLWAVRVGQASTDAIGYAVTDPAAPAIFAPAPISTQLISEPDVPIYPYDSSGIDYNTPSKQSFAGVDLDQWARTIFAGVDAIMTPQNLSALVILDSLTPGSNLAALQANKALLAAMYAQQMQPVFADQAGVGSGTASGLLQQAILQQLGNAYATQAALQFGADVVADITEDPAPAEPPSLYGTVVQNGTPVPGVAFGAARLPLATATGVPLAFLVTTPAQTAGFTASSAISVDLSYQPSQIEHQIGLVPGITGTSGTTPYYASTWLSFVPLSSSTTQPGLQPGLPGAGLGNFEIPMVLRAYPASPALLTQTGTATNPDATDVALLSEWTYAFTYTLPVHYPQDTVHATVVFNVTQSLAAEALLADSFAAMAQFVTVFPDVNADLQEALPKLTPTSAATSSPVLTAARAIGAVNDMLDAITGRADTAESAAAVRPRFTVRDRDAGVVSATETAWAFSVQEDSGAVGATAGALIVTVLPASGPLPEVQIAGYTAQPYTAGSPPQGASQYSYADDAGNVLLFADAQTLGPRTVAYPGLMVIGQQDALTTVYVARNENLVSGRPTSPSFVYRTPDVAFSSPLQPTLTSSNPIDLASIGSDSPATRPLDGHLTALFGALAGPGLPPEVELQIAITYSYTVNPRLGVPPLPVTVPVLFQPPTTVAWQDGGGQTTVADLVSQLSTAVGVWFSATSPSQSDGVFHFDLTITSHLTAQTMPLLRLTNLSVDLTYVNPAP